MKFTASTTLLLVSLLRGATASPIAASAVAASPTLQQTGAVDIDTAAKVAAYETSLSNWKAENNQTDTNLAERGSEFTAYLCSGPNWTGQCVNFQFAPESWNQYNPVPFKIGSFGPGDGVYCIWYQRKMCPGGISVCDVESNVVAKPGSDNLGWWQDNMTEYKCWW